MWCECQSKRRWRRLIDAPFNETTGEIIAAAIEVHRALGPGLLESTYSECLQWELAMRKLRFVIQHPFRLSTRERRSTRAIEST
jgi:GxxExxY protein